MFKSYDESDLLDLIEGRLDAGKAAAMEARLAGDASARLMIERMRADRAVLRSLPEPELPMDFLAQNEHLLARPMLMEPVGESMAMKPGQYRRQQQKLRWRVRWPRLAAAAIVLLAMGAGVWQLTVALWPQRSGELPMVAVNEEAVEVNAVSGTDAMDVRSLRGVIHHALPNEKAMALAMAGRGVADDATNVAVVVSDGAAINTEFALVIRTKDAGSAEAAISKVLTDSTSPAALVRNFSFEEARRMDREWRVAHAGRSGSPQPNAVADVRGPRAAPPKLELKELADHVRQQLQTSTPAAANGAKEPMSGCVAGAKELSPTLEQQLELSSRGATHVLVIPVGELQAMLNELGLDATQATALRMLPAAPTSMGEELTVAMPAMPTLEAWLTDGPRVRAAMQQISSHGSQTLVRVPVVIEISDARR